jgi:hypothetical protein
MASTAILLGGAGWSVAFHVVLTEVDAQEQSQETVTASASVRSLVFIGLGRRGRSVPLQAKPFKVNPRAGLRGWTNSFLLWANEAV